MLERVEQRHEVRLEHLPSRRSVELAHDLGVARDVPQVEQRRRGANVLTRERERVVDAAHDVADLEPRIPEWVEQPLRDHARAAVLRIVAEEEHVDVAVQSDRAPPVATHRDERDAPFPTVELSRGGVGRAEERSEQAVERPREAARGFDARFASAHRVSEGTAVIAQVVPAAIAEPGREATEVQSRL
ncbi:MAG: hypothetical protein H6722_02895 [Sandaracinus sp.]|nr:hypothetical protein [Sandaracinus sp.]